MEGGEVTFCYGPCLSTGSNLSQTKRIASFIKLSEERSIRKKKGKKVRTSQTKGWGRKMKDP